MPRRPPRRNPTENPPTTRGNRSFICRTSRSRPACPPMNTNPIWSAIGNSTRSAAETQTPPATRISQDAAYRTARAERLAVATRTSLVRRAARAMSADAAVPKTAMAM